MTQELIERLRAYRGGDCKYRTLMDQAADALQSQSARIAELEGMREELLDLLELGGDYAADVFNGFRDKSGACARRVEANLERFNNAHASLTKDSTSG